MNELGLLLLTYAQACLVPRLQDIHAAYRQRVDDISEAETLEHLARGLKGLPHHDLESGVGDSVMGCLACVAGLAAGDAYDQVFLYFWREVQAKAPGANEYLLMVWPTPE